MAAIGLLVASVLVLLLVLPGQLRWRPRRTAPEPVRPDSAGVAAEPFLVSALLAGELPATEYRWAMELIAAQDAERHPLHVPPAG